MLDLKFIRNNVEKIKENLKNRNSKIDIDFLLKNDENRRKYIQKIEDLKNKKNIASKEIGKLKREGKDSAEVLAKMAEVSKKIKELENEISKVELIVNEILMIIPNICSIETPIGKNEDDNLEIKKIGEIGTYDFKVKPHFEIAEYLDIIDFKRAVKLSGSRFALFKGLGSKLERALIAFMLDLHTKNGYTEVSPPFLVSRDTMTGSGQLPKFEDDLYKTEDDLFLIPTAEVTLVNYRSKEILNEEELPVCLAAYTPCFRKEAGSYGKDMKGIIRLHQFDKVELVKLTKPENSYMELENLLSNAEEVLKLLKIPYRVINLCTGDIGFAAAKTYDIEVWLPSQNCYREISSCSNTQDFQTKRAAIKYRTKSGKSEYLHALNGSGLAVGRTLVAILENYQNKDGSVTIPEVLRPYMHGIEVIEK